MYTLLQIVVTAGIFAVTLTPAAPAFPVIIVLLVPIRLRFMNKWWNRETLKRMLLPPVFLLLKIINSALPYDTILPSKIPLPPALAPKLNIKTSLIPFG